MVNSPLIRPAISWGGSFGGDTLNSHEIKPGVSFAGYQVSRDLCFNGMLRGSNMACLLIFVGVQSAAGGRKSFLLCTVNKIKDNSASKVPIQIYNTTTWQKNQGCWKISSAWFPTKWWLRLQPLKKMLVKKGSSSLFFSGWTTKNPATTHRKQGSK